MRFSIEAKMLKDMLTFARPAVCLRSTLPVLEHVKLSVTGVSLEITATDLEVGIVQTAECTTAERGDVLVPFKRLQDALKTMDAKKGARVDVAMESDCLVVRQGAISAKLPTMSADSYPELPKADTFSWTFDGPAMRSAIEATSAAVSRDESRFTINGALVDTANGVMVSTDGHRLHLAPLPCQTYNAPLNSEKSAHLPLLPVLALGILQKTKSASVIMGAIHEVKDGAPNYAEPPRYYVFQAHTPGVMCTIVARRLSGNFPDYVRVLPNAIESNWPSVEVSRAEMLSAVKAATPAAVAANKGKPLTFLMIRNGRIEVLSGLQGGVLGTEESHTEVKAAAGGLSDGMISLNPLYLADALTAAETETAVIHYLPNKKNPRYGTTETAVDIRLADVRLVVMPCREDKPLTLADPLRMRSMVAADKTAGDWDYMAPMSAETPAAFLTWEPAETETEPPAEMPAAVEFKPGWTWTADDEFKHYGRPVSVVFSPGGRNEETREGIVSRVLVDPNGRPVWCVDFGDGPVTVASTAAVTLLARDHVVRWQKPEPPAEMPAAVYSASIMARPAVAALEVKPEPPAAVEPCDECGADVDQSAELGDQEHAEACSLHESAADEYEGPVSSENSGENPEPQREPIGTATYSPDDDKIRISPFARLVEADYKRVKAAGYQWAPLQKVFYAVWSPSRERLALEFCGEIEDEDTTLVERAEARAERFETYAEKREREGDQTEAAVKRLADGIPFGQPILIGHHSERRARKDAQRIQDGTRKAIKLWETASYWEERAAGALAAAKYKQSPEVRARRIRTIESEIRVHRNSFTPVKGKDGKTLITMQQSWRDSNPNGERVPHVLIRNGSRSTHAVPLSAMAATEKSAMVWIRHLENRLAYERAMLGEAGGIITDTAEIKAGGRVQYRGAWYTVERANKGAEGRVISVRLMNGTTFGRIVNVEHITGYKAPTAETVAAVKEKNEKAPILNYDGPGFKRMTTAEWKAKHSEYKTTLEVGKGARKLRNYANVRDDMRATLEAYEPHRIRVYQAGYQAGGWVPVFLTDAKVKAPAMAAAEPPAVDAAPMPEPEEIYTCNACGREEGGCSAVPCPAVEADRVAVVEVEPEYKAPVSSEILPEPVAAGEMTTAEAIKSMMAVHDEVAAIIARDYPEVGEEERRRLVHQVLMHGYGLDKPNMKPEPVPEPVPESVAAGQPLPASCVESSEARDKEYNDKRQAAQDEKAKRNREHWAPPTVEPAPIQPAAEPKPAEPKPAEPKPAEPKKITLATVKAFIRKNRARLHVLVKSHYNIGNDDCVRPTGDTMPTPARRPERWNRETGETVPGDLEDRRDMGVIGVSFVNGSRDYFRPCDIPGWTGYEVYNCCGTFVVCVPAGAPEQPEPEKKPAPCEREPDPEPEPPAEYKAPASSQFLGQTAGYAEVIRGMGAETRAEKIARLKGEAARPVLAVDRSTELFVTPAAVGREMARRVLDELGADADRSLSMLEPEAGTGALIEAAREEVAARACHLEAWAVERDRKLADYLRGACVTPAIVHNADFLEFEPGQIPAVDFVLMNPPFSNFQDVRHVRHAFRFLKPGGVLAAVTGSAWESSPREVAAAFRDWINGPEVDTWETIMELPSGTFHHTGAASRVLMIRKAGV